MMAAAAADMKASGEGAGDALAQLEAMKEKMPAAQYEAAKQAMAGAKATMQQLADQPAGNVELVSRYLDRIKALSSSR
jgi:hypothetical protein